MIDGETLHSCVCAPGLAKIDLLPLAVFAPFGSYDPTNPGKSRAPHSHTALPHKLPPVWIYAVDGAVVGLSANFSGPLEQYFPDNLLPIARNLSGKGKEEKKLNIKKPIRTIIDTS